MIRADRGADLCIISIHTPTKGATGDKQKLYEDVYKFQSTLPRRERPCNRFSTFFLQYFNPHSHEGSDAFFLATSTKLFLFQSTLPRRERRFFILHVIVHNNFNPHSHEGSDGYCSNTAVISSSISIHTPTKGATDLMQSGTLLTIFQSTLPRRERLLLRNNVHSDCIFQSTLPRRERQQY